MSIFMMCEASAPGAVRSEYWSRDCKRDIYLQETYKGLVISLGEVNGYDDSDFYAIVWDEEKGQCDRVNYATTRGWTYPNGATVDATPEVLEKVEALRKKLAAENAVKAAAKEAATPAKGKRVKVIKARTRGKDPVEVGVEGTVFYFAADRFAPDTSRYLNSTQAYYRQMWKDPRSGMVVGFKTDAGRKVFINAMNTEVTQ